MSRNLFRGAPDLSRLFVEAPLDLIHTFLGDRRFSELWGESAMPTRSGEDEAAERQSLEAQVKRLRSDRTALLEAEARRIMGMAEAIPEAMLQRMAEGPQFRNGGELGRQRDPVGRSLWTYLHAVPLLEAAERAMQVRIFREHGKLYEAWSMEAPIELNAANVAEAALAAEIADRLQYDDGCKVEAVDLPAENGDSREVLVAVTFPGAYASQKTLRPDRSTEIIYYRPADEVLLVYSPSRGHIEVCSRDATERRLIARIFAETALNHDVSNRPLTQKTYNLRRFRDSLRLPTPDEEAHRVQCASVTEVQIALGDWARKVSLSVSPEEDIDATAREVFGAIIPRSGGGYITRVGFHVDHLDGKGRKTNLKFAVLGRNKSTIQSERDPAKRALGYALLEHWGVLRRVSDATAADLLSLLPSLLSLYDLPDTRVSGKTLDELGIEIDALVSKGFLVSRGWSDAVLFEDEFFGGTLHDVERDGSDVTLTLGDGASGERIDAADVRRFEIRFDYVREALRGSLAPLAVRGRVREVDESLHQLGSTRIGLTDTPIYLARAIADDKRLSRIDRLVRGETSRIRGIVFVPGEVRFPYLGCHAVLSLRDHLDAGTAHVDAAAVRVAYEASLDPASHGGAVAFRKYGETSAQLSIPGRDPYIVVGAKRVRFFERLYLAHSDRVEAVKLGELRDYANFSQLPQLFGPEWSAVNDTYIRSARHGYWALNT